MPADAIWGAAAALAGALVVGVAEHLRSKAQFKRERWWLVYEDRRKRIEDIYLVVQEVRESYRRSVGPLLKSLAAGKLEPFDISVVPWSRLELLVALYAPDLEAKARDVRQAGDQLGAVMAEVVVRRPNPRTDLKEHGDALLGAVGRLNAATNSLFTGLKAESSRLNSDVRAAVNL